MPHVEPQLHRGLDLLDILSTSTGGSQKVLVQLIVVERNGLRDRNEHANRSSIARWSRFGVTLDAGALAQRGMDLAKQSIEIVTIMPFGIVALEFSNVRNPPDVVAGAIVFAVAPVHRPASQPLANFDRFQHRTFGMTAATNVIDLTNPGLPEEIPQRGHQIVSVNVIADLFSFITQHGVVL